MCIYLCIKTSNVFVVISIGHKIALASLFILRSTDKIQFNMKTRMKIMAALINILLFYVFRSLWGRRKDGILGWYIYYLPLEKYIALHKKALLELTYSYSILITDWPIFCYYHCF